MRILLVEPAKFFAEESMNKIIKQTPHIGLAYVATTIEKEGYEVRVLDVPAERTSIRQYLKILDLWDPNIVGFTAMTHNIKDVYEYSSETKRHHPEMFTMVGGAHVNALPEQTLKECEDLNVVVKGEGEEIFPQIRKIYHEFLCKNQNISNVLYSSQIKNLDSLPFPNWGLYDYERIYAKAYSYKFEEMHHIFPIQTMRGCPYNCVFCFSHGLGPGVRFRSAKNIFEEILRNVNCYDASFFYFADSSSTLNRKQTTKLCDFIIKSKLDIAWKCETHVNHVDRSLLKMMKKAGCELIFYGIESGNQRIQNAIGKNLDLNKVKRVVRVTKEEEIKVRAGFILGLPYEDLATARDTIDFAKSLGLERAIFSILDPLPATMVEKMLQNNEGEMRYVNNHKPDWNEIERSTVSVEVNNLTKRMLEKLFREAHSIKPSKERMHKFQIELLYYAKNYPEVVEKYVNDNIGVVEALARGEYC